jgi:UDP-glucose 4-epimerase
MAVYGMPKHLPVDEQHPTAPETIYGLTKLQSEQITELFSREEGIKSIVMRLPGLFGEGRKSGAVHNFISQAILNQEINIELRGNVIWAVLHVDDAAEVLVKAVEHLSGMKDNYEIFNVGYQETIEIKEIAEKIVEMTGSKSPITISGEGKSVPFAYNTQKIERELNYRPKPLKERIAGMIEKKRSGMS